AMNIPPPAAGEGTHWRSEYSPFLIDARSDVGVAGVLAIGILVLVSLIYPREGRPAPTTGSRAVLIGLRCCLFGLVLAVLLPQLRLWIERQGWPDVVLLIDDSGSMSHIDRYREPQVQAAAERLAQLSNLTEADRLQLAQALITRGESDWLLTLL